MLVPIILAALVLFLVWTYYFLYIRPQKMMRKYKEAFEAEGYKVQMLPYKLLGNTKSQINNRDQKRYDDPYYRFKGDNPKYDVTIYNIFNWPAIDIGRPQLLKEFYQPANAHYYQKVQSFISNFRRILGGGILLSQGAVWKDKRKIMNKIFNYDFITDNIPKIKNIIDQALDNLQKKTVDGDEGSSGSVIEADLLSVFTLTYANVVVETFLGCDSSKLLASGQPLPYFIDRLNRDGVKQYPSLPGVIFGAKIFNLGITSFDRDINRRKAIMEGIIKDQINTRISEIQSSDTKDEKVTDIIAALYKMQNSDKGEKKYTVNDICEQFLIFYQAGTDTTAHLMTMMVYYVAMNPQVEQKLRASIDQVIHSDEDLTQENLKKLKYIDWIQNQTTRMYGPATGLLPRTTVHDHYLGNVPISKGTCLSLMIMGIHYSPDFYKQPNQFRPQRWQNQCSSNPPYTLNGFSGGPRNCIGKHLALLQTKITLIKIMQRYKSLKLPKIPKMQLRAIYEPEPVKIRLERSN